MLSKNKVKEKQNAPSPGREAAAAGENGSDTCSLSPSSRAFFALVLTISAHFYQRAWNRLKKSEKGVIDAYYPFFYYLRVDSVSTKNRF